MKTLSTTIYKSASILLILFLLVACVPNSKKIEDLVEFNEYQEVVDRYERILQKACKESPVKLKLIAISGDKPSHYLISLSVVKTTSESIWIEPLMRFQNLLKQDKLRYYQIQLSVGGEYPYFFEETNLDSYAKALYLFRTNLKQIEAKQFAKLIENASNSVHQKAVEDLFDFVSIRSYTDYKLIYYGNLSQLIEETDDISFRIKTTKGSFLHFNYRVEGEPYLTSIDLLQH